MRYLVADLSAGNVAPNVYRDPPARPGTVNDAFSNTLISQLDPASMSQAEANTVLDMPARCTFNRGPESDPVLWISQDNTRAAMKLNGILVGLSGSGRPETGGANYSAPGTVVSIRTLDEEDDRRANAELLFELDQGLTVGYRGFYLCGATGSRSSG